jgi:GTPase
VGTPYFRAQKVSVEKVLREIGTPQHLESSMIELWNKVDRLDGEGLAAINQELSSASDGPVAVPVSARSGEGLEKALSAVAESLRKLGRVPAGAREDDADHEESQEQ